MLLSVWVLGCAGSQAVPAAAPAPVAAPAPPAPPSPAAPVPGQYYNPSELSAEAGEAILLTVDSDGDGFANGLDNCPGVANPDQIDTDGNGFGDACEGPLSYVDIATMLSFSANPARVNRSMTLRMSISNKGDTASGPATLDLNVADEVRFLAVASSGPWKCKFKPASGWLNCTAGNLEPGATKTVVLRMKPLQAGTFRFWARAESVHHEHDFENNVVTSELVVGL